MDNGSYFTIDYIGGPFEKIYIEGEECFAYRITEIDDDEDVIMEVIKLYLPNMAYYYLKYICILFKWFCLHIFWKKLIKNVK